MDSKTFIKHFIEEQNENIILEASYIIASNNIKFGTRYKDQMMKLFYLTDACYMKIHDEKDKYSKSNSEYVQEYFSVLNQHDLVISTMIKLSIEKGLTTIIITTPKEDKIFGHLELLKEYIEENFQYKIIRYKPGMKINNKQTHDKKSSLKICDDRIKKEKKKKKKKQMKTKRGQQQYFSTLGKKKLKRLLQKEGLYLAGMPESEMIDIAMIFLV